MPSEIEKLILSNDFQYLQPYFYTNPFALRCELGMGEGGAFRASARRRANEIHDILMPGGADAIVFDYWMTDYSGSGPAEAELDEHVEALNAAYVRTEARQLEFLLFNMARYRHTAVKNLRPYYDEIPEAALQTRTRMVCYSDGKGFDDAGLIELMLADSPLEISLVSLKNECILSVYDDRGCDVTFASKAKMREFYERLKPYFLEYDIAEMEKRYNED